MCHSFIDTLRTDLSSTTIAKFVEPLGLMKGIYCGLISKSQLSYSSTNTGRIFFPSLQCAAAFATSYPELWSDVPSAVRLENVAKMQCLIPMAIDQDVYFRLLRENCHRMSRPSPKPALIHSRFHCIARRRWENVCL